MDGEQESNLGLESVGLLDGLCQRLGPCFARSETRGRARRYVLGLLRHTERKNSWQLAEKMDEAGPQGMQRLLNAAKWDVESVRDEMRAFVVEHLGEHDGLLVVDETGFLKKGSHSAGVARQYSGTAGRIENQQVGVFLAYVSNRGSAFIDRALYLPEEWMQDPARCLAAGIPASTGFATKTELAQQMLVRALAAGVPARWVVADTIYATDELRLWLEGQGLQYVLAVPCTYEIWTAGQQVSAQTLIAQLAPEAWIRLSAGEGSQGPRYYDWAWMALPYRSARGRAHWLMARRSISTPSKVAYYHVYAPHTSSLAELVRIAGSRWPIEVGFQQAKGEVGLDQYQVRRCQAWYRHMTLALLAHAYLVVLRSKLYQAPTDQIPLSVPELRRLVHTLDAPPQERQHHRRWSTWRRQHQARAKRCHTARRQSKAPPRDNLRTPTPRSLPGIGSLTESRWQHIQALLPARPRAGRPAVAHRQLLEGMLFVMQVGVSWHQVPPAFGPWQTVYTRYQAWLKAGLWTRIVSILAPEGSFADTS
jgi:SRSO17 transposase